MTGQRYNSGKDDGLSFRVERRELRELLGLLKDGESVLVTGGRKLGKTVLLEQARIHFELQVSDTTPVAVPLYQDLKILTRPVTAAPFFDALSRKVAPAVNMFLKQQDAQANCQPAPNSWKNDPSLEFSQYLKDVLDYLDSTVGRVTFIYLLDECEQLLGSKETHTLMGNLRALIGPETNNRIKLVVTGFRDLKEYSDPETGTSPLKNVLRQLPLGLFQEDEFNELVQPLLESLLDENRDRLRKQLWGATGGHPCVIQIICSLLSTGHSPQSFDQTCATAIKHLEAIAFSSWVERFKPVDHELFWKALKGEGVPEEKPLSAEFLQYCGVLTIREDKLLAPCGLFNTWYERQHKQANNKRKSEQTTRPGEEMRASEQSLMPPNISSNDADAITDSIGKPHVLVMKGGGVKGLAYIGALKELEKHYSFDWFVGTSAGAIAAVLLAVGYTTEELENILSGKNFKEFLDSSMALLPLNLIFKGGFYEARSFTTWLDNLIAARIKSFEPVQLMELPKRVTIYASRRQRSALIFDKHGPNSDKAASFAVRCSMSIPFVFTPQRDQGLRVLDGGMQNNYPIAQLLKLNPGTEFIGLYLGHYYEGMAKEPWLVSDMLSMWTEAVDVEALKEHKEKTVVIDPRPIKTIDFNLTAKEKEFLLSAGRAAALRFLFKRKVSNGPTEIEVEEAEEKTLKLKAEVEAIRANHRRKLWIKISLFLLLGLAICFYLILSKS